MNRIVLMTDFSKNARNAIHYAINLFGESVNYLLVNTYIARGSAGAIGNLSMKIKEKTLVELESELKDILNAFQQFPNLNITTLCEFGEPVDVVKRIGERNEADLVVMGTKGASGIKKAVFGSVTSSVIQHTALPVLSVPEEAQFNGIKQIVFAADLSKNKKKELIAPLKSIAVENKAEVSLLHVWGEGELPKEENLDSLEEIRNLFKLDGVDISVNDIEATDTIQAIQNFCVERDADLLSVIARHNRFWDHLFHKSVSQELAFALKMPLLTLEDSF